jgi:energy-coupling factor transport system substrate-specific component
MKKEIPVKQLAAISLLVATAAAVRVGMNWAALALTIPIYGVLVKIGLTETLTFVSGFVFGPLQGFITGLLIIIISDLFTLAGLWTPFIAVVIGMLGLLGGLLRRFKPNPSIVFLGAAAVALTMISELLQNIWFAWYMWAFYMPQTAFVAVLGTVLVGGVKSTVTALINNVVLFTAVAPTIIKALREMLMPKTLAEEKTVQS